MAARDHGDVLLVGSVARPEDGWSVEDVLRRSAGALAGYVSMLPDGELGPRSAWIDFIAEHTYARNADLVVVSKPGDGGPASYEEGWKFAVREGVDRVRLGAIGYAEEAARSYEVFQSLQEQGVIADDVRFMVALPLTESAVRPYVDTARDYEILAEAYHAAMLEEIERIASVVPHGRLAIQWDLARETAAVEGLEFGFASAELRAAPADPIERFVWALRAVLPAIPDEAWVGLHICYGSFLHDEGGSPDTAHFAIAKDLGVAVDMLNAAARDGGRRIDFVHMPVQLSDTRHEFYAPLERLQIDDARVYLGLADVSDGVGAALRRIEIARVHLASFGIATPCGWGRRPIGQRPEDLLALEREVAESARTTRLSPGSAT